MQLLGVWAFVHLQPSQVRGAASPWLQRNGSDLVSHTIRDAVAAGANVTAAQGAYGGATRERPGASEARLPPWPPNAMVRERWMACH